VTAQSDLSTGRGGNRPVSGDHFAERRPDWVSQVVIRQMRREDLPALEWNGQYTHFRRLYEQTYQSARWGRAVLWVAEIPGTGIIGQLFVQLNSGRPELADGVDRAYIYGFRVKDAYRGYGVGSRMMDVTEAELVRRGFRRVTLNVGQDNPDARRLYENRGYTVVASEPGRWSYTDHEGNRREVHEPAWRMEKVLQP